MNFDFPIDEDTLLNVEHLVIPFMVKYNNTDVNTSVKMINYFFQKNSKFYEYDDITSVLDILLNHDHPFYVAANVVFQNSPELMKKYGDYYEWLKTKYGNNMPASVDEDYKRWHW